MTQTQAHSVHDALRILIVDDDEADRRQMRRALKQAALSSDCVETATIDEALAACSKGAFDCAIVDYRMPGHDGLHGIVALHERVPLLPIIMVTGSGDEMIATEAMKRGALDYILKAHVDAASIKYSIENALEKAALRRKLKQQQDELESFASVLVHDLSAPIASLQLFARAIEEELSSKSPDNSDIADHCREVVRAGQRTGALIDTLYEYTKVDAEVAFDAVEMRNVMGNAVSNLKRVIQERGARVTHGELPFVIGHGPQLVQLLQNLIGNGIKYNEAAIPTVHVTASPDRENIWRFAVQDNGIGIPEPVPEICTGR